MSFTVSGSGGASGTPGNIVINNGADVEVKSTDGSVTVDDSASTAEKKVFDLSVQASGGGVEIFSDDFNYKIEEYNNTADPTDPNNGKMELKQRSRVFAWGAEFKASTHEITSVLPSECVIASYSDRGTETSVGTQYLSHFLIGQGNHGAKFNAQAFGYFNYVSGDCLAVGFNNQLLYLDNEFLEGRPNLTAFGFGNRVTVNTAIEVCLFGRKNTINSSCANGVLLGNNTTDANPYESVVIANKSNNISKEGDKANRLIIANRCNNISLETESMFVGSDTNDFTGTTHGFYIGANIQTPTSIGGSGAPVVFAIGGSSYHNHNIMEANASGHVAIYNDIYIDMPDGSGSTEQVKLQDLLERLKLLNNSNGASGDTYGISTDPTIKCTTTSENGHTDFRIEIDRIQPSTLIDYYGTTYTMGDIISALRNLGALN